MECSPGLFPVCATSEGLRSVPETPSRYERGQPSHRSLARALPRNGSSASSVSATMGDRPQRSSSMHRPARYSTTAGTHRQVARPCRRFGGQERERDVLAARDVPLKVRFGRALAGDRVSRRRRTARAPAVCPPSSSRSTVPCTARSSSLRSSWPMSSGSTGSTAAARPRRRGWRRRGRPPRTPAPSMARSAAGASTSRTTAAAAC